jgi:hypothetical protein
MSAVPGPLPPVIVFLFYAVYVLPTILLSILLYFHAEKKGDEDVRKAAYFGLAYSLVAWLLSLLVLPIYLVCISNFILIFGVLLWLAIRHEE